MGNETKYPDVMPKVTNPPNYVERKSGKTRKKKNKARKGQAQVDPVAMAKQLGENQQAIMQTPEAKQRFKDTQDPFKNGFFKNTPQPAFDPAKAKNAVDVAKQEQTNAQKLFAPATPNIQTDAQGNKLAMRNGQPVGYSGTPEGSLESMSDMGMSNPNKPVMGADGKPQYLGYTDSERRSIQQGIGNVAANFKPVLPAVPQQSPNAEQFSMPQVSQATGKPIPTPMTAEEQMMFLPGTKAVTAPAPTPIATPTPAASPGLMGVPGSQFSWMDMLKLYPNFADSIPQ